MPFVQLSAQDDQITVFWRSNLPDDDVDIIHKNGRPTVLILVPGMLSVEFLDHQFNEASTLNQYNIIAFDTVGHGRTQCPVFRDQVPLVDEWFMAA